MTKRVLVVEDDLDMLDCLKELLESNGFIVEGAQSGNDAVALLNSNDNFDLVLTDYIMPNGNGLVVMDFIKNLKDLGKNIRMVMLSGQNDLKKSEIIERGADAFMQKPFHPDKFISEIFQLLK